MLQNTTNNQGPFFLLGYCHNFFKVWKDVCVHNPFVVHSKCNVSIEHTPVLSIHALNCVKVSHKANVDVNLA